ncbi:MAG: O-antigen ligase family protein [Lentisphaeria bacterium]
MNSSPVTPIPNAKPPAAGWSPFTLFLVLAAVHVPLAYVMRTSPTLGIAHALLTGAFGLFLATMGKNLTAVAGICAYIAGSELLWRMSGAPIFWEYGKLIIGVILVVTLFRQNLLMRGGLAPAFFLLLLPSAVIPLANVPFEWARQEISFNLFGPLILALSTWLFRNVAWTRDDMTRVLLFGLLPIVAISIVGVNYIATHEMTFTDGSNYGTSMGYGPNQVSTVLGLGAFICFLLFTLSPARSNYLFLAVMGAGLIGLAAHSAITFSRGGLYSLGAGVLGSLFFLLNTPNARSRLILAVVAFVLIGGFYLLPRMNQYTSGALSHRLQDTKTTGRADLMAAEWELFKAYPVFGAGPGKIVLLVDTKISHRIAAHTEFTRLISEHGAFGLAALVVFVILGIQNFFRNDTTAGKAISAGLMAWVILTMFHAAMRLAAPGFIFGLAAAKLLPDNTTSPRGK